MGFWDDRSYNPKNASIFGDPLVRAKGVRGTRHLSALSVIIGVFFEAHVPEKYFDFHCINRSALCTRSRIFMMIFIIFLY